MTKALMENSNSAQRPRTPEAAQTKLTPLELGVLNRRIFEASFPDIVNAVPFDLEKATVRVRVLATKEPITLVLCSYDSVRWWIQEEKGAKIDKVLVGGYHLQGAVGTDALVSYFVYDSLEQRGQEKTYFYAYDPKDSRRLSEVAATLRMITGKEIETFQGRSSYAGGPALSFHLTNSFSSASSSSVRAVTNRGSVAWKPSLSSSVAAFASGIGSRGFSSTISAAEGMGLGTCCRVDGTRTDRHYHLVVSQRRVGEAQRSPPVSA